MNCAVVLAAGRSRRMGVQKLLLPVAGQAIIVRIVDALAACPAIDRILLVTGRDAPALRECLDGRPVRFVENPDPEGDMLSSVRCGLRAVPEPCAGALIVLGDQPGLSPPLVADLMAAAGDPPDAIVVPTDGTRRGHPVFVPMRYRDEICTRFDGVGLRGLLAAHAGAIREVLIPDSDRCLLDDIDTPEDYERIRRQLG